MKPHAMREQDDAGGSIVLPRKLSLAVAALIVCQVFYFGYSYAVAVGRIEKLEAETRPVAQINERTIRMEEQLAYIKAAVDRLTKR